MVLCKLLCYTPSLSYFEWRVREFQGNSEHRGQSFFSLLMINDIVQKIPLCKLCMPDYMIVLNVVYVTDKQY